MIFNQLFDKKFNEGFNQMKPSFSIFISRSDLINNSVQSL